MTAAPMAATTRKITINMPRLLLFSETFFSFAEVLSFTSSSLIFSVDSFRLSASEETASELSDLLSAAELSVLLLVLLS